MDHQYSSKHISKYSPSETKHSYIILVWSVSNISKIDIKYYHKCDNILKIHNWFHKVYIRRPTTVIFSTILRVII